ncbi:MAG: ribonuclease H-like domain-containing protein [Candidatus Woesearchaeota archaeon]|jgi:hypothetical protein|nr:ribonuclease H-like domain-containing protein [Candidatus Woesearchaeota archaeon]
MIRNSYIFLEKVNKKTEQHIWNQGITDWDSFLQTDNIKRISKQRKPYYDRQILKARAALYQQNSAHFKNILPSTETWRLYNYFKEDAVFLDIETTGLSSYDDITVVGLYDGITTKTMIQGINLNPEALKQELQKYKLMVTFNGASFDLPFIRKRHPDILPDIPHLDLRHACKKLNLTGGLKNIEKQFDIKRRDLVDSFHGGDAVTLWKMYKSTGDDHYINLLVEYNEEDIINLKTIANSVCNQLSKTTYSVQPPPPYKT